MNICTLFLLAITYISIGHTVVPFSYSDTECNIEIELILHSEKEYEANDDIEAELLIHSSSWGLAFYSELRNVPVGEYKLSRTNLNKYQLADLNVENIDPIIVEDILSIYVDENEKGRTHIADEKRNCKNYLEDFKDSLLIIHSSSHKEKSEILFYAVI